MPIADELARFVVRASYHDLSAAAREALKVRVLDALGCALGALDAELLTAVLAQIAEFGGASHCTLIGGGRTAPDRAALYNSALIRYLDFNDSYLAPGETCHPSDNLGAVLAGAEYAGRRGRELLTALAVAYQVQCRLSDVAPVRARGFDHVTHGAYSIAAGISKALGLEAPAVANALAMCGAAFNALRVTRTGGLSHWKGLAFPNAAFACTHATFLAKRGLTAPAEVFEGNKGFMDAIAGPFTINWANEDLERVTQTIVKRFNAEVHAQSAIEGVLELKEAHGIRGPDVDRVDIDIFDVAYHIIGGGEEGDKRRVRTKEEADHSLPYMIAVALLDGEVTPAQYRPERIRSNDVQSLLQRVTVRPRPEYSRQFPQRMPCAIRIHRRAGGTVGVEKLDYAGFHTRPLAWTGAVEKFHRVAAQHADPDLRRALIHAIAHLDDISIAELMRLLATARRGTP